MNPSFARPLRTNGFSSAFVAAQIAFSLVLLLAAVLLLTTVRRIREVPLGFDPEGVMASDFSLSPQRYNNQREYPVFVERLTHDLAALPGIERAALVYGLPLSHEDTYIPARALGATEAEMKTVYFRVVSPAYFELMRVPVRAGRVFSAREDERTTVAIVSATTARLLFGELNPIGRQIICGGSVPEVYDVIGVVGDVRSTDLTKAAPAEIYFSVFQQYEPELKLVIRSTTAGGDVRSLAPALLEKVHALDPEQPALEFQTLTELVAESVAHRKWLALGLSILAGLSVSLALLGIYSVMNFTVLEKRREIGLRLALGASRAEILGLVLTRGLKLTLNGVLVAAVVVLIGGRFFSGLLFQVSPTDPFLFLGAAALLIILGLVAIYLPARRAMRVDPMVALRT